MKTSFFYETYRFNREKEKRTDEYMRKGAYNKILWYPKKAEQVTDLPKESHGSISGLGKTENILAPKTPEEETNQLASSAPGTALSYF